MVNSPTVQVRLVYDDPDTDDGTGVLLLRSNRARVSGR